MTYDFHGTWEGVTGHNSPLYKGARDTGDKVYLNTVSGVTTVPLFLTSESAADTCFCVRILPCGIGGTKERQWRN